MLEGSPAAQLYQEWEKPLVALNKLDPIGPGGTRVVEDGEDGDEALPPPSWFLLFEAAEKAEAPTYSYEKDRITVQISKDNRRAERRLKAFWKDLDAMLESRGAMPAETKALFAKAQPLETPKVTVDPPEPPATKGGKKSAKRSTGGVGKKSTGGVGKKTKKGKSLSALNIAAAAAASSAEAEADDTPVSAQPSSAAAEASSSAAGPSGTQATFTNFSAGVGVVDAPRRPALEERRQKEKTRGVPDPTKEPVRAPEGQAPAPEQQIPVSRRAMDTLTLLLGPFTVNQPVPWTEVLHMVTSIGFSVRTTKTNGSQRIFEPTDYLKNNFGVRQALSKHRPHPQDFHYLNTMREWARNTDYGMAKLGWTLDTFKLEERDGEGAD